MQEPMQSAPKAQWWETRSEPVQLALDIPASSVADAPQQAKVSRSCPLLLGATILRIYGLVVSVATFAYGGWCFFEVKNRIDETDIVKNVAQGIFLCFIGLMSFFAEIRTRWTMRGCINTYILFSSYLARGMIYVILGAIIFALQVDPPAGIKRQYVAGGIIVCGVLNILYYPSYWKYERRRDIAAQTVVKLANPEEVIYGMDALYIRKDAPALSTAGTTTVLRKSVLLKKSTEEVQVIPHVEPVDYAKNNAPFISGGDTAVLRKSLMMKKFSDEQITPEPMGAGEC